jgi:UDP-N-acetylmuramoylalanine--D-glutamate ligase
MDLSKKIFHKKKILIYGMGKTGISGYQYLKKNNQTFLYDDNKNIFIKKNLKKLLLDRNKIQKSKFDFILTSPGINVYKCDLKDYLKKNQKKIITDLDIFYNHYFKNKNITITGSNGKSTTAKILFDILKCDSRDVRLTGNIGNPILLEKKITSKTIFIIEASSYQLEYSKNFKANYAIILNITPDHLERHGTFLDYAKAKLKLIKNQKKQDYAFVDVSNKYIKKEINNKKLNSQIINVDIKSANKNLYKIKNSYFFTEGNKQNLSFIFAITKKLGLRKKYLIKKINNFKALNFRQEVIFRSKKFTLINDSKATSFPSSITILKSLKQVYWILGGIPKKEDKFSMTKKQCLNFKAYIFGKNKNYFVKKLKNKMVYENFYNLSEALKKVIIDIKLQKNINGHKTILFSPSSASFDSFKNFEDRGRKFNNLVKKLNLEKSIHARS